MNWLRFNLTCVSNECKTLIIDCCSADLAIIRTGLKQICSQNLPIKERSSVSFHINIRTATSLRSSLPQSLYQKVILKTILLPLASATCSSIACHQSCSYFSYSALHHLPSTLKPTIPQAVPNDPGILVLIGHNTFAADLITLNGGHRVPDLSASKHYRNAESPIGFPPISSMDLTSVML